MPFPIFERLSELFPKIKIVVAYADEDLGNNLGVIEFKGGGYNVKKNEESFGSETEAALWAAQIKGYDEDTLKEIEEDYKDTPTGE